MSLQDKRLCAECVRVYCACFHAIVCFSQSISCVLALVSPQCLCVYPSSIVCCGVLAFTLCVCDARCVSLSACAVDSGADPAQIRPVSGLVWFSGSGVHCCDLPDWTLNRSSRSISGSFRDTASNDHFKGSHRLRQTGKILRTLCVMYVCVCVCV